MADEKISALNEKTTITNDDLLPIVDTEASPDETKKIKVANIVKAFPKDIYNCDYGLNWADLGVVTTDAVYTIAYLGNGVAVIGDEGGHVWRSTNFGLTWTDLGAIASNDIFTIACLGNGIAIMGDGDHHIFRSTDYGLNWTDLGVITTAPIYTMAYLGDGIAVLGDGDFHVWRSTDYGANWADLGVIAGHNINFILYMGSGIAVLGTEDGHVFRSTNYGANWADLGQLAVRALYTGTYLGNGLAVLGDEDHHIWHSTDFGLNWTDLGVITTDSIWSMAYLGNGVVILGDQDFHIWRSTDYGFNWTDLGVIAAAAIYAIAYLGNGIAIMGGNDDHVYRSASAFQVWNDGMPPLDDFLENPPTEDEASKAPTSEWAFDHAADANAHHTHDATDYVFKALAARAMVWRFAAIGDTNRSATVSAVADDVITLTTNDADQFFSDDMEGYCYLLIRNTTKSENAWVKAYVDADEIQVTDPADISGWQNGDSIRGHSENWAPLLSTDIDLTPSVGENAKQVFVYAYIKDTAADSAMYVMGSSANVTVVSQAANIYNCLSGVLTLYPGRQLAIKTVAADSAMESVVDINAYTEAAI